VADFKCWWPDGPTESVVFNTTNADTAAELFVDCKRFGNLLTEVHVNVEDKNGVLHEFTVYVETVKHYTACKRFA
jgi:hypothetical protein